MVRSEKGTGGVWGAGRDVEARARVEAAKGREEGGRTRGRAARVRILVRWDEGGREGIAE